MVNGTDLLGPATDPVPDNKPDSTLEKRENDPSEQDDNDPSELLRKPPPDDWKGCYECWNDWIDVRYISRQSISLYSY